MHKPKKYKGSTGVEVEAMQLTDASLGEMANWTQGQIVEEKDAITGESHPGLNIRVGDSGRGRVSEFQYVVKYGDNFYVSVPRTFEAKFKEIP